MYSKDKQTIIICVNFEVCVLSTKKQFLRHYSIVDMLYLQKTITDSRFLLSQTWLS